MMTEILPNLYIGTVAEAGGENDEYGQFGAVVNLSGAFHRNLHHGELPSEHHCYLICEYRPDLLSVNWVDARDPKYFDYKGEGVWVCERILDFLERNRGKKRLIICDRGISRAPSMGMLYMFSRYSPPLDDMPLDEAISRFKEYYPQYEPGLGIYGFLLEHWKELV